MTVAVRAERRRRSRQDRRCRRATAARRAWARSRRLVGEPARAVLPDLDDVAVAVEDVVDDLEEQPELGRERPPRRVLGRAAAGGAERRT